MTHMTVGEREAAVPSGQSVSHSVERTIGVVATLLTILRRLEASREMAERPAEAKEQN
jgi:hypothetical protein